MLQAQNIKVLALREKTLSAFFVATWECLRKIQKRLDEPSRYLGSHFILGR